MTVYPTPHAASGRGMEQDLSPKTRRSIVNRGVKGFTLLEIVVAILIFSMLITALFASFRDITSSAETLNRENAFYLAAHIALSRITRDLQSIYVSRSESYKLPGLNTLPDPYRMFSESSAMVGEKFSTLHFASFEHVAINGDVSQGISQIVYYCQKSRENGFILRRSDHAWPYEPFKENNDDPILCENIKSLRFKFQDGEGQTRDEWDSDAAAYHHSTPRAVEIQLEIGDDAGGVSVITVIRLPLYRENVSG